MHAFLSALSFPWRGPGETELFLQQRSWVSGIVQCWPGDTEAPEWVGRGPQWGGLRAGFHTQALADRAPGYLPQLSQQLWPLCFERLDVFVYSMSSGMHFWKLWNGFGIYIYVYAFSPLKVRWEAGEGNVLGCCAKNLRLARCNEVYDACLKVFATYSGSCEGQTTAFISPACRWVQWERGPAALTHLSPHTSFFPQPGSISNLNFALRPWLGPPTMAQERDSLQPYFLGTLPGAVPMQPNPCGPLGYLGLCRTLSQGHA